MVSSPLRKGYLLTDIHFGKKSNSVIHNTDCIQYLEWFCTQFKQDPDADYVAFLGDWHENRTAIDVSTLSYSYQGAKMLNDLGVPVFFIVGNHDLGTRDSRALYSTIPFHEFDNFILVHEDPVTVPTVNGDCLFVPFLMPHEYGTLHRYEQVPVWMGHFEFKGFVLTGYTTTLEHGPDHGMFSKQRRIFSGHFHKRQTNANVTYIGNTFPMDYGDANNFKRGLAVYDHTNDDLTFINWTDCPKYIKCKLSQLLDDSVTLHDNSYVFVEVDISVDYEELSIIEQAYSKKYQLREFKLDETSKFITALDEDQFEDEEDDGKSTTEIIMDTLKQVDANAFDCSLLTEIYTNAGVRKSDGE